MRTVFWAAFATLAVDQLSKFVVVEGMNLRDRLAIDVVPPWLNFRMAWNQGVNFGLLANGSNLGRWLLILVALAIAGWVAHYMRRGRHGRAEEIAAGLLIGGALGNVIDRLRFGAVADFLNMSCCGMRNPFSFNLADVGVFLGAVGMVLLAGRQKTP